MTVATFRSRALVVAIALGTAFLALPALPSLDGWGIVVLVGLVMADAALVVRTGALAYLPASRLDERLVRARDLAYRLAFRLVGLTLVVLAVSRFTPLLSIWSGPGMGQRDTLWDGTRPGLVFAVLQLLLIMPTLVLAWQEPVEAPSTRPAKAGLIVLAAPILAGALAAAGWTLLVTAAVPRGLTSVEATDSGMGVTGARCSHVVSVRDEALGLGGVVRLRAEVCWNGRVAFIFGAGPVVAIPPGAPPNLVTTSLPDLMSCGPDLDQQDLVRISHATCRGAVDSDGTLHYRASGHLFPTSLPIGGRDVVMDLVVRADGHIVISQ